jgi:protein-disulfide isomerase
MVHSKLHPVQGSAAMHDRKVDDWRDQLTRGRRIGPASAAVTVLEYGDFECPACAAFFKEFERVRAAHPNDLSLVFRHFPLKYHSQAYPSARAAECAAEQGQFEHMYQMLYSSRDSLGLLSFHELAKRAAVANLASFDSCFASDRPVPRIEADLKAGAATNIPGTPAIIVDGVLRVTSMPAAAELERLVREALAKRQRTSGG